MILALKAHFVPVLASNGWMIEKRAPQYDSPDMRQALPLGRVTRTRQERVEVADIQFDKYGTEKFRVLIGSHPNEGRISRVDGQRHPPNALAIWEDPESQCLRPNRILGHWFGFWPWEKADNEGAERLAKKLSSLWSEAEEFFSAGSVGPHLKRIGLVPRSG